MMKFCNLFSGSSGNSTFFSYEKTKILIDAGSSMKNIKNALSLIGEDLSGIHGILVTHEHIDHFSAVCAITREYGIPVYLNEGTLEAVKKRNGLPENIKICPFETGMDFEIRDILVSSFRVPHDACEPVGFNLLAGKKKITIATDIGHITRRLLEEFENADLLFLEANHDVNMLKTGPYPWSLKQRILGKGGHLSNEMAGKVVAYMAERGTGKFILGHLSAQNNLPELAYKTVADTLAEKGIRPGPDVSLTISSHHHRDGSSDSSSVIIGTNHRDGSSDSLKIIDIM